MSLGVVDEVRLDQDLSHVVVKIRMDAKARPLLTNHARLWVVRPNLSPANLGKALETLVSGAYIEIDPGAPGGRPDHRFVGSTPPRSAPSDEPGRTFVLQTRELGSLSVGAAVSYRGMAAGEVRSLELAGADGPIRIRIFVNSAGDRWASPLADMIGRVLLEDLSTRLPGSTVVSEPLELATDPEVSVDVDVQRFESGEDGVVALQASVVLEVGRSDRVLRSRTVRLSARPSAPGTGPLVETLSVLLGRLADAAVDLVAGA